MVDSVYDRSLDIVAEQITTLANAIDPMFLTERLEPREFDWDDINNYPGVSLRYVEDPEILAQMVEDTNVSTNVGYPIVIVANWSSGSFRDGRRKKMRNLFESIRRYYSFQRRLQSANIDNVARENSCTVRIGGPNPPPGFKPKRGVAMLTIIGWFMEARTL